MNYEELSDFDINMLVAENLGLKSLPRISGDIDVFIVPSDDPVIFNPCNVPNDAFPIILEHGISIGEFFRSTGNGEREWRALPRRYAGEVKRWSYGDKNPLRCAMIVFLKMHE